MKNVFTFHPVGQGLFYTGSLLDGRYNFVYDCGTENQQKIIRACCKRFAACLHSQNMDKKMPEIDFVVVSHLHNDHFSGLFYLSQICRIKKFYLPYIGENQNLISLILAEAVFHEEEENGQNENRMGLYRFMRNLYVRREEEVVFIGEQENSNKEGPYCGELFTIKDERKNDFWKFLLFSKPLPMALWYKYALKLDEFLRNKGIEDFNAYLEEKIFTRNFKDIQEIYVRVFGKGKLNATSIVMLHYPIENMKTNISEVKDGRIDEFLFGRGIAEERRGFCCQRYCYIGQYCYCDAERLRRHKVNASLLTGDAEFDLNMGQIITNELRINRKEIFMMQTPHHGAYDNWALLEKCKLLCDNYVIPFGLGNKYHHPGARTIYELMNQNANIYKATQIDLLQYSIT